VERTIVAGTVGASIDVAGTIGASDVVHGTAVARTILEAERAAVREGSHDAYVVCRPLIGPRQCNSGRMVVCVPRVPSCAATTATYG
jgi:hypothetical protein